MSEVTLAAAREAAETRRELTERLKSVLVEKLSLPMATDEIADDSPLFGLGLGLDSVDALEIVIAVEQEFDVQITDNDMHAFRSIGTVLDFIQLNTMTRETEDA